MSRTTIALALAVSLGLLTVAPGAVHAAAPAQSDPLVRLVVFELFTPAVDSAGGG